MRFAVLLDYLPGDIRHVFAPVCVVRQRKVVSKRLHIAGVDGPAEILHLEAGTGIVDVGLARDVTADGL